MPEPQRSRNLKRAERKFELMEQLGTDFLLVCSNVSPQAVDDMDRVVADLRELAELAAKRNIRVGFEALAWGATSRTTAMRGKPCAALITLIWA